MSVAWHTSDLHFQHRGIVKHRMILGIETIKQNDEMICDDWVARVQKRDYVYIHGDVSFDEAGVKLLKKLPGQKGLILGNHDLLPVQVYLENGVERVFGTRKYKGCWLSHFPIHPEEFRNTVLNIHGHVHMHDIEQEEYFNVSCDSLFKRFGSFLIRHTEIKRLCGIENQ